ncbi:winged helix-turn-helix transcriptional regulator [Cupriavidus numazuensis]|jgi:DNA-binding HxlR family transcriptional regulator|uniref:winged helix-turn-helix transcriptional regulator n=1 Tax=Cupriavidus numazuensis TaxID=221992 RepID=UPI001BAE1347
MDRCRQLTEDKRVRRTLELLGERWTLLLLGEALLGRTRFDEFQQSLGMAPSTLAVRLRLLVEMGLLERRGVRCNRLTYHLTESGAAMRPCFDMLAQWANQWMTLPDVLSVPANGRPANDHETRGEFDEAI